MIILLKRNKMYTKEIHKFNIKERLKSFIHAINGIKIIFKYEHNFRIHFFAALTAIISGLIIYLSNIEWIVILIIMGIVFICEIFNSAIENLSDFVSPEYNELIKKVKDMSAAAVLVSAILCKNMECNNINRYIIECNLLVV